MEVAGGRWKVDGRRGLCLRSEAGLNATSFVYDLAKDCKLACVFADGEGAGNELGGGQAAEVFHRSLDHIDIPMASVKRPRGDDG